MIMTTLRICTPRWRRTVRLRVGDGWLALRARPGHQDTDSRAAREFGEHVDGCARCAKEIPDTIGVQVGDSRMLSIRNEFGTAARNPPKTADGAGEPLRRRPAM